jgi:RimJ/RimL family protein N-acetyltransferase
VKKLIDYGFSKVNLNKISIFINPKSKAMWKVAERSGMKYLGHVDITEINSKAMYFSIEIEEFKAQQII